MGLSLAAAAWALLSAGESREGAVRTLTTAALLLPLLLAHGMVSSDLRSGVALLWLQRPVGPVRFYLGRWGDVSSTTLLVMLAAVGVAAGFTVLLSGAASGRAVIDAVPILLLWSLIVTSGIFGFSAWGTSMDSTLMVLLVVASVPLGLLDMGFAEWLGWLLVPVDALFGLGAALRGRAGSTDMSAAALELLRFVAVWVGIGCLGAAVTTRHPFPRDTSR